MTSTHAIVFCSGAWHTEYHIRPVRPYFENGGYHFIPCPLVSAGSNVDADTVITTIKNAIEFGLERCPSVAVILHSAAGLFGAEAVNRVTSSDAELTKRIKIIFLASMLSWGPIVSRLVEEDFIAPVSDEDATQAFNPANSFFNDMTSEDAKPFVDALQTQTNASEPVMSSEAWKRCDLTHVCCMRDNANPFEWQVKMAEDYGMRIAKIDAGHDPFISTPSALVEVVDKVLLEKS